MIKFMLKHGRLPIAGSLGAAGLDIHCAETFELVAHERLLVHTGVYLAGCPNNVYLRVAPRSKLANKFGVDVLAGVVDSDYRGEICVVLMNHSANDLMFDKGEAIAQLIPTMLYRSDNPYQLVQEVDTISGTVRGSDGINDEDMRRS